MGEGFVVWRDRPSAWLVLGSWLDVCSFKVKSADTTMKIPQVVIDTNVLIAAQRSQRGASAKLMSLVGTGRFDIHVSVPLVLEYEEVLLRSDYSLG